MLGRWDESVFRWINDGWSHPLLDAPFRVLSLGAKMLPVQILLGAILLFLLAFRPATRAAAVQAMLAWPLANELADAFKWVAYAARPSAELADALVIVPRLTSSGTMSAHSATMAAVAAVMVLRLRWWGAPWVLLAALVGLSRVYVGVHYPSQVLLGWLGGVLCGLVIVRTWDAAVRLRGGARSSRPSL